MVARVIVAMRKWLRIVGAERNGRTAIPHRHGKYVDLLQDERNSVSLRRTDLYDNQPSLWSRSGYSGAICESCGDVNGSELRGLRAQ